MKKSCCTSPIQQGTLHVTTKKHNRLSYIRESKHISNLMVQFQLQNVSALHNDIWNTFFKVSSSPKTYYKDASIHWSLITKMSWLFKRNGLAECCNTRVKNCFLYLYFCQILHWLDDQIIAVSFNTVIKCNSCKLHCTYVY